MIDSDDAIITSSDEGRTFAIIAKTNCIDRSMITMQHMVYLGKLKKEFILCHVVSVHGELQDWTIYMYHQCPTNAIHLTLS